MKPKDQPEDSNSLFDFASWGHRKQPRYQRSNRLLEKVRKRAGLKKRPLG